MFTYDEDGQCYVSSSANDFTGWQLLGWEQWKEGVKRVHVRKDRTFYIVFAEDSHVERLIEKKNERYSV